MADDRTPFVDWFKETAAEAGYDFAQRGTAATMATDAGVDHGQISRILNGKATPKAGTMVKLAAVLGVRVEDMARRAAGDEAEEAEAPISRGQALAALVRHPDDRQLVAELADRLNELRGES